MDYDSKVFKHQFPIVKWFVYHLIYCRTLSKDYKERGLKNEFWKFTIDAHLLQATINWCMVFGSDNLNSIHWKQLSTTQSTELSQSFRVGLFEETSLDDESWDQYWKNMTDFRNKYAAHREFGITIRVPDFDVALAVAYHYDKWVRRVIYPDVFTEPPLDQFATSLQRAVGPLISKLFEVTETHTESGTAEDTQ